MGDARMIERGKQEAEAGPIEDFARFRADQVEPCAQCLEHVGGAAFRVNDALPCLTTGSPQAAATKAAAVETLIEPEKSPPVPQLSAKQ